MSLSPCTQRLYNIFKTASGKEPVSDADFTNLFWPRHELSLGEISLFFGHFANLVRPLLFSLNAVGRLDKVCNAKAGQSLLKLLNYLLLRVQGYAVVSREDNPLGPECCAEFTLLKVEQPANCTA